MRYCISMLTQFEIIPAVDVLDGRVVRLERGEYDAVTVYGDDPSRTAAEWMGAGAPRVHVVDLAGARDGVHSVDLWRRLAGAGVTFQVGGGIRDAATAAAAVAAGAERVVTGTAAVWNPDEVRAMVDAVGAKRVVVAVDVRDGRALGAGWRDRGKPVDAVIADVVAGGVERVLVTGIARDGMKSGPDTDLLDRVAALAPDLAVIASGGVGSLADVTALAASGAEGVIVGRALYDGAFTYAEALGVLPPPP